AGTPNAGSATISHAIGCANRDLILNATGVTIDLDIEYQWQSSPDGNNPWTDIIGANSTTFVANSATDMYYRMRTLCTSGNEENFTNTVSFQAMNSSVYCEDYCETPLYSLGNLSCANNFGITNVTFGDLD